METKSRNDIFDFGRFGKYLGFDLRNAWSNFGWGLIILAAMPLILYLANILFHNLWESGWSSPGVLTRTSCYSLIAALMSIVIPSRLYGQLTSKKEGTDYLMIPSSTLEKFISMILISVVIIPVAFIAVYWCLDWVLSLCDPTYGQAIVNLKSSSLLDVIGGVDVDSDLVTIGSNSPFSSYLRMALGIIVFLLGALCFKKWKIVGTFGFMIAVGIVLSFVAYALVKAGAFNFMEDFVRNIENVDTEKLTSIVKTISTIINLVLYLGLMACVYFRLKTIKH